MGLLVFFSLLMHTIRLELKCRWTLPFHEPFLGSSLILNSMWNQIMQSFVVHWVQNTTRALHRSHSQLYTGPRRAVHNLHCPQKGLRRSQWGTSGFWKCPSRTSGGHFSRGSSETCRAVVLKVGSLFHFTGLQKAGCHHLRTWHWERPSWNGHSGYIPYFPRINGAIPT